ncbi:MAG TPA: DNA polymerase/3'-5' exonuclease PolX [Gemmatimonadaceae bacterium]|nr:DNA polymerase/3'-5' exonuclease PolX [Gemmatimonadaceae bacterium]
MDSRTAAHVLNQIGALLELNGSPRFKARAFQKAARSILALGADDLTPLLKSGELKKTPNVGPATLSVIQELIENGESNYLERLTENTPPGLIEMVRVPGLGIAKVRLIHRELGVENLEQLEEAARDGRLAKLPRFGPKTAERVLAGIEFARESVKRTLYHRGLAQALILSEAVERHPDVSEAIIAGTVRRHHETIGEIDIVAICDADPAEVARSFADARAVKEVTGNDRRICIRFIDETRMNLWCAPPADAAVTLWRATGSPEHILDLTAFAKSKGFKLEDYSMKKGKGRALSFENDNDFFAALGLDMIPPELREGMGEVEAAANGTLPDLITSEDIKGALHCHSTYSDGGASIEEMANAARERRWKYIGISDHSQAAFYAGGMKRDEVLRQHEEIDELNATMKGFRILKGIECDILTSGELDYGDDTLDLFDYIVGSVHSQFKMDRKSMTDRILRAMDDPRLTILGHPTGRLLLSRDAYAVDVDAVIDKAAETGTVLELNCDPHRMDLDWRHCRQARDKGVMIAIGPDAHSEDELDNVESGVGMARKAWLTKGDVLNAASVRDVLAVARRKRL